MPADLVITYGWDRLEPSFSDLSESVVLDSFCRLTSRGSLTAAEKGWKEFMIYFRIYSWKQDLYANYLTYRWALLLLGPLACDVGGRTIDKWGYS